MTPLSGQRKRRRVVRARARAPRFGGVWPSGTPEQITNFCDSLERIDFSRHQKLGQGQYGTVFRIGNRAIKVSDKLPARAKCPADFTKEYQISLAIHQALERDPLPLHLSNLFGFVVSHCFVHSKPPASRCYLVMDLIENFMEKNKPPHRAFFMEGFEKEGPELHKSEVVMELARHKLIPMISSTALFGRFGQLISWFLRNGIVPYDFQCLFGTFNQMTKLWVQDFGLYKLRKKKPSKYQLRRLAFDCAYNNMEPKTRPEKQAFYSNLKL